MDHGGNILPPQLIAAATEEEALALIKANDLFVTKIGPGGPDAAITASTGRMRMVWDWLGDAASFARQRAAGSLPRTGTGAPASITPVPGGRAPAAPPGPTAPAAKAPAA